MPGTLGPSGAVREYWAPHTKQEEQNLWVSQKRHVNQDPKEKKGSQPCVCLGKAFGAQERRGQMF